MKVILEVRNESSRKRMYRREQLRRLAEAICTEEGYPACASCSTVELSVLFCDDVHIQALNREYRKKDAPTDVLSFAQPDGAPGEFAALGDIVISLETVARRCENDPKTIRDEVLILFCHGVLHLLDYDHRTSRELARMIDKQAHYLAEFAWPTRRE